MSNLFISINTGVIVKHTHIIDKFTFKGVIVGIDRSKKYDYNIPSYYKLGHTSSNWSPDAFIPYLSAPLNKLKII